MGVMIVTDAIRAEIQQIILYAALNPITVDPKNTDAIVAAGNNPRHRIMMPIGIKCVYSHEVQKGILFRHFSMSVDEMNRYPHPVAVDMMLEEFGFRHRVRDYAIIIWQDDDNQAINCLEVLNEKDEPKVFTDALKRVTAR